MKTKCNLKSKIFHLVANTSILLGLIFLITGFYWLFFQKEPIEVFSAKVSTKVVMPGDMVKYDISYCSRSDKLAHVSRKLVDGMVHFLPPIIAQSKIGCYEENIASFIVPDSLDEGTYYLEVSGEYRLNPLKHITITYETDEFRIIKPYESN